MLGILRVLNLASILRLVIRLLFDRRVPLGLKMVFPAALLYILSPIDLIPDFLPFLGQIDDLLVTLLAVLIFLGLAPRDVLLEHVRGRIRGAGANKRPSEGKVIEGSFRYEEDEPDPDR